MKFTIVSHACMYIEHDGRSLLVDPWIVGSCYWRSWWNFPEPDPALIEALRPDVIYLTHLHWDHFHGPSLRRFDRATKIVIPKTIGTRMVDDLRWLGFHDIVEVPHGGRVELAPGFELHSFQFGHPTDSAIVVTDGRTTLFDVNDAKFFGAPLAQIRRRFSTFDFVFKSHSSASPIPYCIDGYEGRFAEILSRQDYIEEFAAFGLHIGARYAIPFASNHCFLHRDTIHFNDTVVNPDDVRAYYDDHARAEGHQSRCIVMPPGSSWDDRGGFQIRAFDYAHKAQYVSELGVKYGAKLAAQYAREEAAIAELAPFAAYFEPLFETLPRPLAREIGRIVFRIVDAEGTKHFGIDFAARAVRAEVAPARDDVVIDVPALILNDLVAKRMFSAWTPSKRLKIGLPGDSLRAVMLFLTVIDYYETGYLPLRGLVSRRMLGLSTRRVRELAAASEAVLRLLHARHVARVPLKPKMFFPTSRRTPRGASPRARSSGASRPPR